MESEDHEQENREHDEFSRVRENLGADGAFTERVAALRSEFPEMTQVQAEELLDFLADSGWLAGQSRLQQTRVPAWMSKFVKILGYIKQHPNVNAIYAVLHIWDDPLLDDLNGGLSQTEFADKMYPSHKIPNPAKAAVNNAVMDAMKFFGTKPRRDQRREESRQSMSAARLVQLKEK